MATCMTRPVIVAALALSVTLAGCSTPPAETTGAPARISAAPPASAGAPGPDAGRTPATAARRVVFLGDSLTAGLGLPIAEAYPSLIAEKLTARGRGWTVVNAGVSGDTSAGGARRLEWSLDGGAAVLVVALGGNDALRGLPPADLERNLDAIVTAATAAGTRVVLAGMEAPPNNGPEYTARFRRVYADVAKKHDVTLLPFLLEGVAGIASLNQADGIHPNPRGAVLVAATVWRVLEPIVRSLEDASTE